MITNLFFIMLAYLVGSLSSAILVCRFWGLPDPREKGSKNPGATNVLRLGGKLPALITLLGDGLKGLAPTMLAISYLHNEWLIGAIMFAAFMGHIFPLYFDFQGGKGVATAVGCYLGLSLPIGAAVFGIWALVLVTTRISSLAAIIAALFAPIIGWVFLHNIVITGYMVMISLILLLRHRENIQRLWQGKEKKI